MQHPEQDWICRHPAIAERGLACLFSGYLTRSNAETGTQSRFQAFMNAIERFDGPPDIREPSKRSIQPVQND
jgi:hypothetical protein